MAPSELTFQVNEDFDAPIDKVFSLMTDPLLMPQWVNGVDDVRIGSDHVLEVGEKFQVFYQGENSMVMDKVVLSLQPNETYSTHGVIKDFFEWNERIQFQSLDTVHTRISTFVTLKSLSNKSRLFMYAEETHKQNVANNYIKLKSLIE
jgi:uncharacterized protein YndB with AHSA1/START domain